MHLIRDLSAIPAAARHGVVALGNFDGLHRGHQAVIGAAKRLSEEWGAPLAVLTFEPHPREFFQAEQAPLRIYPLRKKLEMLRQLGVEALFLQRFNKSFATLSPHVFIREILRDALSAQHVVTGEDFVFGRGRAGNADLLAQAGNGFGHSSVATYRDESGQACSSTRIRSLLTEGDMTRASFLLGRPYRIGGRVLHGDKRGRQLGFPTANIRVAHMFKPAFGVYAVKVTLPEGRIVPGVANLGMRPTFGGMRPLLEVHCFDFSGDLYGRRLSVEPVRYLRPEQRFDGAEHLRTQIAADCAAAREALTSPICGKALT